MGEGWISALNDPLLNSRLNTFMYEWAENLITFSKNNEKFDLKSNNFTPYQRIRFNENRIRTKLFSRP